jgi:type III secretory pathway component EscR
MRRSFIALKCILYAYFVTILLYDLKKGGTFMANLSEIELQNVRHLLQFGESDVEKYRSYAQNCQDENIKQFFEKSAQSCEKNRQTILKFLQ